MLKSFVFAGSSVSLVEAVASGGRLAWNAHLHYASSPCSLSSQEVDGDGSGQEMALVIRGEGCTWNTVEEWHLQINLGSALFMSKVSQVFAFLLHLDYIVVKLGN